MKPYDILLTEPEISSDNIEAHQDFSGLMASYKQHHQKRKVEAYKTILGILALLLAVSGIWFLAANQHEIAEAPTSELLQPGETGDTKAMEQASGAASLEEEEKEQEEGKKDKKPLDKQSEEGKEALLSGKADSNNIEEQSKPISKAVEKSKPAVDEKQNNEDNLIYSGASPKEGFENLHAYFNEYLVYPEEEFQAGKEGTVLVSFLINEAGKAEKIKVTRSVSPSIDQEAIRLIREMPAWNPADVNGKPVISRLNLPVIFKITDYEKY